MACWALSGGPCRASRIKDFLPPLARVPPADESTPSFRTAMQCSGRRQDGEVFLADVWFSTYQTSAGPRLAAMLVDSSEDLRDKEESSLHHLMVASRLAVGAVSHEIRNVCGAISVVYENLSRHRELAAERGLPRPGESRGRPGKNRHPGASAKRGKRGAGSGGPWLGT